MNIRLFAACALPLAALITSASPVLGARHAAPAAPIALSGTVQGTETRLFGNPDVGAPYKGTGAGKVSPLGTVAATNTNHGVGFIRQGQPTGTMTLSTTRGSITLAIAYDTTPGFAPLPSHGTYAIIGGTGSYAGATGKGSLSRKVGACGNATAGKPANVCPLGTLFAVTYTLHGDTAGTGAPTGGGTLHLGCGGRYHIQHVYIGHHKRALPLPNFFLCFRRP